MPEKSPEKKKKKGESDEFEKTTRLANARAPYRHDPLPFLEDSAEKPPRPENLPKTELVKSPRAETLEEAEKGDKPERRAPVQGPRPLPGMVPPREIEVPKDDAGS